MCRGRVLDETKRSHGKEDECGSGEGGGGVWGRSLNIGKDES